MNILGNLFGGGAAENEEEVQRMERRMGMLPQAPNPMTNGPTMPQPGLMPIGGIPGSNTIPDASRFVPPGLPGLSMDQAQAALNSPQPSATSQFQQAVGGGGLQPPRRPVAAAPSPLVTGIDHSPSYMGLQAPQAGSSFSPPKTYSDSVYGALDNYNDTHGGGGSKMGPGDGLKAFTNNGGLQTFKAADVGPADWQGPVLPHENTGKRVGAVEGSVADSPLGKLAMMFMGGGF